MTPAELLKSIRNRDFPSLVFLYGSESFTLEKAQRRLIDAVIPAEGRDFNLNRYHGKDCDAAAVLDTARTFPVFASHRLVLVKDAHQLNAFQLEKFLDYLRDPVPETVLVFTAEKIDGRKKFFQEFKKRGALVEFKKLYDNQIPGFIREQAKEAGRSFTEDALRLFCRRVGTHLQEIHAELVKLFDYLGERTLVDVADVAAVVSDTRVDSVFDFTDALGKRNRAEALRLLGRIMNEGSAPLLILSMMVRHFRQLWKTRELVEQGVGSRDIARRVGINPYFVDGLVSQCRGFSMGEYRQLFVRFLETDLALKSSGANAAALLEQLVLGIGTSR